MLPKNQRLTSEQDFKRVYQKGSFFSVGPFAINYLQNRMPFSRVGIVVTKKFSKKATERNLTKRRFREVAHEIYAKIPVGFDVIIVIRDGAKKLEFKEIQSQLSASVPRIGQRKRG